jgi:hypothetical protein
VAQTETRKNTVKNASNIFTAMQQTKLVSADIGNHFTKVCTQDSLTVIESTYAEIINVNEAGDLSKIGSDSAFIEYLEGDRRDLLTRKWIAGARARVLFPDTGSKRIVDEGRNEGKPLLGLQILFAAIEPPQDETEVRISLAVSMPNTAHKVATDLKTNILGRHKIRRNGVTFTINFVDVKVFPEGNGAHFYALAKGVIKDGQRVSTVDIGGGTTIVAAYDSSGMQIETSRLVVPFGVNSLAQSIARDGRITKQLGADAKVSLILEALRKDQPEKIYAKTSIDFTDVYNERVRNWLDTAINPAQGRLREINDDVDAILIIGGGSKYLAHLTHPKVKHFENAQTVHVEGMLELLIMVKEMEARRNA